MERGYLPTIGDPDPEAVRWIHETALRVPWAMFRRHGLPAIPIIELVKQEREAIERQEPFRRRIIETLERESGIVYRPAEAAAYA